MPKVKHNRLRILLVDDDEDEFILTRDLLADRSYSSGEAIGFTLDWVDTFDAALDAIEKDQHHVYLVDYRLGNRDGLQLLREASAKGCNAPFILMTGHGSYSVDVEAMKVGATDYLVKSDLTPALLERTIRYALERKRTEAMQRENELRLRLALKAAHLGRWDLNIHDDTIISYEDTEIALGLEPGEFPGSYSTFLEMVHLEDRPAFHGALQNAIDSQQDSDSYEVDFRVTLPDGGIRWLQGKGQVFRDGSGRPVRLTSVISDITERKRLEDQFRRDAARAGLMASLSQAYAESRLNFQAIISAITVRISESSGDICVLRLLSEDTIWLDPAAYHHPDATVRADLTRFFGAIRRRADEGLAGQVITSGQPLLIPDTRSPQENPTLQAGVQEWMSAAPVRSALIVPLRAEGRLFGSISMLRIRPEHPYTTDDLHFYQDLADRAALALENARLYASEARRASELDALQTATAALLSTIELEPLLGHILDVAQSAIPAAEKSMLYLVAPETGQLQIRAVAGYRDPRIRKTAFPHSRDYPAKALLERAPMLIRDAMDAPSGAESAPPGENPSNRSALIAPLVLGSETFGVLSLTSSKPGAFTEADLRLLVSFATTTTAAIQNAILHAEVQKLAITDTLTEVYNRRGFYELGRREVERAHRFGRPLSAILVDIDNFKEVNDTHGHAVGDEALLILSERFHTSIREVDILGRYGGDEFVLLLPETDLFTACAVAERIRLRVAEPLRLTLSNSGQVNFIITASFGVANLLADTPDLPALIERADHAAYLAKRNGRNRVEVA